MTCRCCDHPIATYGFPACPVYFQDRTVIPYTLTPVTPTLVEFLCVPCALYADRLLGVHGICFR